MTHCSDDELVLHHYGESPDATAHVAACAACTGRARDLALLLASVDEADVIPERGTEYGHDIWARVQPHVVMPAQAVPEESARTVTPVFARRDRRALRWALAVAATVTLVATSFVAGRLSMRPAVAPDAAVRTTQAAVTSADPQMARRVLLLSVADHLERSDRVLTEIMNAPVADISIEQQWADDLVAANRLYRQDALDANETSVADVLDELERTLLDVVHRPSESPADLESIRRRIDSAALLFKVRVLTTELRQRQLAPDAASAGATTPIS